eukprot:g3871.t1
MGNPEKCKEDDPRPCCNDCCGTEKEEFTCEMFYKGVENSEKCKLVNDAIFVGDPSTKCERSGADEKLAKDEPCTSDDERNCCKICCTKDEIPCDEFYELPEDKFPKEQCSKRTFADGGTEGELRETCERDNTENCLQKCCCDPKKKPGDETNGCPLDCKTYMTLEDERCDVTKILEHWPVLQDDPNWFDKEKNLKKIVKPKDPLPDENCPFNPERVRKSGHSCNFEKCCDISESNTKQINGDDGSGGFNCNQFSNMFTKSGENPCLLSGQKLVPDPSIKCDSLTNSPEKIKLPCLQICCRSSAGEAFTCKDYETDITEKKIDPSVVCIHSDAVLPGLNAFNFVNVSALEHLGRVECAKPLPRTDFSKPRSPSEISEVSCDKICCKSPSQLKALLEPVPEEIDCAKYVESLDVLDLVERCPVKGMTIGSRGQGGKSKCINPNPENQKWKLEGVVTEEVRHADCLQKCCVLDTMSTCETFWSWIGVHFNNNDKAIHRHPCDPHEDKKFLGKRPVLQDVRHIPCKYSEKPYGPDPYPDGDPRNDAFPHDTCMATCCEVRAKCTDDEFFCESGFLKPEEEIKDVTCHINSWSTKEKKHPPRGTCAAECCRRARCGDSFWKDPTATIKEAGGGGYREMIEYECRACGPVEDFETHECDAACDETDCCIPPDECTEPSDAGKIVPRRSFLPDIPPVVVSKCSGNDCDPSSIDVQAARIRGNLERTANVVGNLRAANDQKNNLPVAGANTGVDSGWHDASDPTAWGALTPLGNGFGSALSVLPNEGEEG